MAKVKRSVIRQGKTARAIILPGFWLESFRAQGYDVEQVWIELIKKDNLLITPILKKSKKE